MVPRHMYCIHFNLFYHPSKELQTTPMVALQQLYEVGQK